MKPRCPGNDLRRNPALRPLHLDLNISAWSVVEPLELPMDSRYYFRSDMSITWAIFFNFWRLFWYGFKHLKSYYKQLVSTISTCSVSLSHLRQWRSTTCDGRTYPRTPYFGRRVEIETSSKVRLLENGICNNNNNNNKENLSRSFRQRLTFPPKKICVVQGLLAGWGGRMAKTEPWRLRIRSSAKDWIILKLQRAGYLKSWRFFVKIAHFEVEGRGVNISCPCF